MNRIMPNFRAYCAHEAGILSSLIAVVLLFHLSCTVVSVTPETGWHRFEPGIHLGWSLHFQNPLDGIRGMENRI